MDLAKYAALFQSESREQLSTINEELLALERAPTASEPVSAVFRAVHSMKGMSATMGYATVTALEVLRDFARAHAGRDILTPGHTQEFAIPTATQEFAIPTNTPEFVAP